MSSNAVRSLWSRAIPFLKFVCAAALIAWMVRGGKLDLSQVLSAWAHWPELLALLALTYFAMGVAAWRLRYLLHAQDVAIPYGETFALNMIGALFNIVIPGAVGGDVVKGYYVGRRAGSRRTQALTTILMDRVLGLLGLMLLAAVAAWRLPDGGHRDLRIMRYLAIAMALGGVLALSIAVQASVRIRLNPDKGGLVGIMAKLLDTFRPYHRNPWVLPVAAGISMLCHSLACFCIYLSAQALGGTNVPLGYFFLIVPLGMMTTALPISPAGIGVGQAAFFALFGMIPGSSAQLGANALTVYQSVVILVYLTGIVPYLSYKEKIVAANVG